MKYIIAVIVLTFLNTGFLFAKDSACSSCDNKSKTTCAEKSTEDQGACCHEKGLEHKASCHHDHQGKAKSQKKILGKKSSSKEVKKK